MNVSRPIRELSIGEIKVILNTLDSQHQFCKVVSKSLFISFFFHLFRLFQGFAVLYISFAFSVPYVLASDDMLTKTNLDSMIFTTLETF